MKKVKIKAILEIEIDPEVALEEIANTIKEAVEYEIENGYEDSGMKIIDISSDEIDVNLFYANIEDYIIGKSYKNEKEYIENINKED